MLTAASMRALRPCRVDARCFLRFHSSFALPPSRIAFQGPSNLRSPRLSPLSLVHTRSLFLRPSATPSPLSIVRITQLEAEANSNPNDVGKQVALFKALVDADVKEGWSRVMSRWERTSEFDPTNPLIRSDEAFQLYLTSLVKSNLAPSVSAAVARREQLLALPPPPPPESPANPTSRSQEIAQAVLADSSKSPSASGVAAKVATAAVEAFPSTAAGQGVKGNPVHVVIEESRGYLFGRIVKFILITCLYGFVVLTILSLFLENSGLLKAGPSAAEFEPAPGTTVRFSDVHGVDEAKEELQEVVEFLKDPTAFATLGGKLPKGVLLTGPPGTGKTMLARAVAGEAGVPFLFASGSDFDEMFVGVGAKRIRELFATARKKQPSIIFIDELDAIGSKRTAKDQHYMKQTLNQLLVELDGFSQTEGVIVIAATNFPQSLDQALVRPGRFDKKVAVPLPDVKGRVQILKHHMHNIVVSDEVDPSILARGTPGFSGADLQNMVNQAAIQASKEGQKSVTLRHFEWAKDKIIMGAERKSSYIDDKAKTKTAYHEGGHALVALYTEGAMPLHKVTCVPRGLALGMTMQLPENDRHSVSYKEYLAELDVCMGGRVAEEIIFGKENVTSGASSDLQKASSTARRMVKNYGYSDKVGPVYFHEDDASSLSPQKKDEIEGEVRSLLEASYARTSALLKSREQELHKLAKALTEFETLDLEEVKKVISGQKIREGEDLSKV